MESSKEFVVLLVDDAESDQVLFKRAVSDLNSRCHLMIVNNGMEALHLLDGMSIYADRKKFPIPHLIMLDINMPVLNGWDTLKQIRDSKNHGHIPVTIMTTSSSDQDIKKGYSLGANAFLTKPVDDDDFQNIVAQLEAFWFKLVSLPTE